MKNYKQKKRLAKLSSLFMSLALILGLLLPSASIDARTYNKITAQAIGITVDADKTDWADVESLGGSTDDDNGKVGSLGELYLANDEENLYFWVDANEIPNWEANGMYINIAFNTTGVDSGYSVSIWGSAFNYEGMVAKPNYQLAIRDRGDSLSPWFDLREVPTSDSTTNVAGDSITEGVEISFNRTEGFEGKIPLALLGLTPGDIVNPHVALSGNNDPHGVFDAIPTEGNELLAAGSYEADPHNVQSTYASPYTIVDPTQEPEPPVEVESFVIHEDNSVTFSILDDNYETMNLAGSMNGWSTSETSLSLNNGVWTYTSEPLQADDYAFKFVANGDQWIPDGTGNDITFTIIDSEAPVEVDLYVINEDRSVTFNLVDDGYSSVNVAGTIYGWDTAASLELVEGVWSYTTEPLDYGFYEFKFIIDTVWEEGANRTFRIIDPEADVLETPVVNEDGSVTFYYQGDETTTSVNVPGQLNEWNASGWPMTKGEDYLWSYTSEPLSPATYQYKLVVNGAWINDPANTGEIVDENNTVTVPYRDLLLITNTETALTPGSSIELAAEFQNSEGVIEPVEASFALETEVAGVSIDTETNTLTIAPETEVGETITVVATYDSFTATKTFTIVDALYNYTVNYYRYDNSQMDWDLWVWTTGEGREIDFATQDDEGFAQVTFSESEPMLNVITRPGSWSSQESTRIIEVPEGETDVEVWLLEGDNTVYYSREDLDISDAVRTAIMDSFNELAITTTALVEDDVVDTFTLTNVTTGETVDTTAVKTADRNVTLEINDPSQIRVNELYEVSGTGFRSQVVAMRDILSDPMFYYDGDLGLDYSTSRSIFRVWAPTAASVDLMTYDGAGNYNTVGEVTDHSDGTASPMNGTTDGVWTLEVTGDLAGQYYMYRVEFADGTVNYAVDPYAYAVSANGQRGAILDLNTTDPGLWTPNDKPDMVNPTDAIIYELHVRDFSIDDSSGMDNKGKFLAFTENGTTNAAGDTTGIDHLHNLGVTHIQLLPPYDFKTVNELEVDNPDSNQAKFNWGYDPQNFNVPEGSYSTDPTNPQSRITEFKQAIQSMHDHDMRVIMDVVYNHTYSTEDSSFEKIVPGYYHRTDAVGNITNGSGTGNEVASERPMVRKFIKDSVRFWVDEYGIDGFRFDLMALIDTQTMVEIVEELHNEVDPDILVLGEPWQAGGSPLPGDQQTVKGSQRGHDFAVFNDNFRNAVRGDGGNDGTQGFVTGATGREMAVVEGVLGSFNTFTANAGETINYVTAHDNLNNWDKVIFTQGLTEEAGFLDILDGSLIGDSAANYASVEEAVAAADPYFAVDSNDPFASELVRMSVLMNGIVLTSQGVPFIHAGDEMIRTKYGDHNSYKSPDAVNKIRWENVTDFNEVYDYYQGLIQLRNEHPAFRMAEVSEIQDHLKFIQHSNNVVSFQLIDNANGDSWNTIFVAYNANRSAVEVDLPSDGTWNQVVSDTQAGVETIDTVTGSRVSVEPLSMVVFYDSELEDERVADRFTVIPNEINFEIGDVKALDVTIYDQIGGAMPELAATFEVADESIATVDNRGVVRGVANGETTVTVRVEGLEAQIIPVIVETRIATAVEITGDDYVYVGTPKLLSGTVIDQYGDNMNLTVTWESADPSIARVDSRGYITGITEGTTTITASYGDLSATIDVQVREAVTRYVELTYVREDGNYDGWNLWLWNTGVVNDQHLPTEITEDGAVFLFEIGPEANNIGFIVRRSEDGNDWAEKDVEPDRYIEVHPEETYTKIVITSGEIEFKQLPTISGPVIEDGNATFYYRDQDLFVASEMDTVESVTLLLTNPDDSVTEHEMTYDAENEYFTVTLPDIAEGEYTYEYEVTIAGETTTTHDEYNHVNGVSSFSYELLDLTIEASVNVGTINSNQNAVVTVDVTPSDVSLQSIQIDLSSIGGRSDFQVDPELGEATIAVTSSTTAGLKTLPITILDEFGNTHESSVEIEVAATPAEALAWDEAVIYFMLTDRFANGDPSNDNPNGENYDTTHPESYHGGDFQGIIDNLDYLDELGVNTIWITPIVDNIDYNMMASAGEEQYGYHGYWAKDFTKIDEHLGTAEKFEELIDAAHDRGIKIMLDVVLNHAGYGMKEGDTSSVSNFPTPEEQAQFAGMFRTEFANDNVREELAGLPDFLTEVPEISAQIIQWYVDLIDNTTTARGDKIDYFRVDTVSNVESQTWSEFKNEIAKVHPDHKMIGEYYGAGVNNQANMLRTGRMDSLLDFEFKQIAQNFINGDIAGVENALSSRNAQLDNTATLGQFLSSHDEDGFLLTRAGGDINKFKAAVALQLTAKGQPVIYYGEEIGLSGRTAGDMSQGEFSENRYDFDWNLVDENLPITDHYRKLLEIRGDYSLVFARGDRQQLAGTNTDGYSIFSRTHGETVYVGINIDETAKTVSFATGLEAGTGLVDLYNNVSYVVDADGNVEVNLPSTVDGGTVVLVEGEATPSDLQIAIEAVVTAEEERTQESVDAARTLVDALPDSDDKTTLQSRLAAVQEDINEAEALSEAVAAVVTAETERTQESVDEATALVDALPDSDDKTTLLARLDAVQEDINEATALSEAIEAVVTAETERTQESVDTARALVDALPDSDDKTTLQSRLDAVQAELDAVEPPKEDVVVLDGDNIFNGFDSVTVITSGDLETLEEVAIIVDGVRVVLTAEQYTAVSGSTIITIPETTLNGLSLVDGQTYVIEIVHSENDNHNAVVLEHRFTVELESETPPTTEETTSTTTAEDTDTEGTTTAEDTDTEGTTTVEETDTDGTTTETPTKTGEDGSNLWVAIGLLVLAGGLLTIAIVRKRREEKD